MEKKQELKPERGREGCGTSLCAHCEHCPSMSYEELRPEWKDQPVQLYATESQNYFFYYALLMKQG